MTEHLHHRETERRHCSQTDCEIADKVADRAVRKVFAAIDVDIDDVESVKQFRNSLRFGEKLNKWADYGSLVFIGVLITALAGALIAGIVMKIRGG